MNITNDLLNSKVSLALDADITCIEITQELYEEFKKIYFFLMLSIKKAEEMQKPFILLVGENHYSLKSFLFKILIIDMAYQLGITKVGYESTRKIVQESCFLNNMGFTFLKEVFCHFYLKKLNRDLSKLPSKNSEYHDINKKYQKIVRTGQDGGERLFLRTINYIKKKNMHLFPIDIQNQDHDFCMSEEGMNYRDTYMASLLSLLVNDNNRNVMAIVGDAHLLGIYDELKKNYFVIMLSTVNNLRFYSFANNFIAIENKVNTDERKEAAKYIVDFTQAQFTELDLELQKYNTDKVSDYKYSKDFLPTIQRESLKMRAILGIPRTLSFMFNIPKSFIWLPKKYKKS